MSDILINIAAFIVAIGVMVTVHEYGHYWVARRCGVRVLRFSFGFGRPLWRRQYGADRTEWMISALPLGGYVKMLDEREGEVDPAEAHRAFNRQTVGKRAAIVAAGPLVNILLAVVTYSAMYMLGVQGVVPRVGDVTPDSPAAVAGFQQGDRIVAIDGDEVATWRDARLTVLDRGLGAAADTTVPVTVETAAGGRATRTLDVGGIALEGEQPHILRKLGVGQWFPRIPARITDVQADSAAARAGLRADDRVLSANGQNIESWSDWVDVIREHPGKEMPVVVERDGQNRNLTLTPERVTSGDRSVGRIGARGPTLTPEQRDRLFVTVRHGPFGAVGQALTQTWEMTALTGRVLVGLVTGSAALSNISGPVSIAQYAGQSARIGIAPFLGFIGIISISIGLLNLLPVPVLDGGHLLYYAIEAITGSPVSENAQILGQKIGIGLLLALMGLAFYNDILRLVH